MRGKKLTEKESLFCYYAAFLVNPVEAAVRAGYSPAEAAGISARLLAEPAAQKLVKAICADREKPDKARSDAIGGLWRIAFGSANDAVRLLLGEESMTGSGLADLDLFGVSEIRRQKGGGLEIKFFDRLKALALLLEAGGKDSGIQGGSIYEAILSSAATMSGSPEQDDSDAV